ncbi:hypothetical protein T492DRAFT_1054083 [Pavlovales sp. CCMP2436]|nr:hypothetical protein T492DRAFT_1054083 [Pavlovales sp. CCMP2436]
MISTLPSARRHAYTRKPDMSGSGLDFDQSARPSFRRGISANERGLGGPSSLTVASRASTPSRVRLRHEMVPFAKKSSAPPSSSKVDTLELDPVELGAHGHPNLLVIVLRCAPGTALARAVEPGQAEVDCVRFASLCPVQRNCITRPMPWPAPPPVSKSTTTSSPTPICSVP